MRTLILSTISALTLIGTDLAPVEADAVQLAISVPLHQSVFESRNGQVTFVFEIVNTGVPTSKSINIDSIKPYVDALAGDSANEVVAPISATACSTPLDIGASCKTTASYRLLDADPFDTDKTIDSATWFAGITVDWSFAGGSSNSTIEAGLLTIKDDPVPEPAVWMLMIAGSAAIGGHLRGRRTAMAA